MRRGGVKSFVDDLVLGRGVVISRAATSLRSVETQPWTRRFVRIQTSNHLRPVPSRRLVRGCLVARWLADSLGSNESVLLLLLLSMVNAGSTPAPGFKMNVS